MQLLTHRVTCQFLRLPQHFVWILCCHFFVAYREGRKIGHKSQGRSACHLRQHMLSKERKRIVNMCSIALSSLERNFSLVTTQDCLRSRTTTTPIRFISALRKIIVKSTEKMEICSRGNQKQRLNAFRCNSQFSWILIAKLFECVGRKQKVRVVENRNKAPFE